MYYILDLHYDSISIRNQFIAIIILYINYFVYTLIIMVNLLEVSFFCLITNVNNVDIFILIKHVCS